MKKTRFFLAPIFVFFDFKIYREARDLKTGTAVLFAGYLSLLFTLAIFIFTFTQMSKIDGFVNWLKQDFPSFTISQNGVKADQPGRHEIRHPEFGLLAVIDDSVETVSNEQAAEATITLTSKMIYVKKNGVVQGSVIGSEAKKDFSAHIDSKLIEKIYLSAKIPVATLIFVLILTLGFLSRILSALFLGLAGMLIQLFIPRQLSFGQLFKISVFALAIALPFNFLQYIPGLGRFFSGFVGLVLAVVYLILAISTQPKAESKQA